MKNPQLLTESAQIFGSQCIGLAVDVKRHGDTWRVYSHGGTRVTLWEATAWVKEAIERGAGEILLTSMDADGTQKGVDLEITRIISDSVNVPVIASGGIGTLQHFKAAIEIGNADAVLAASVFHRGIFTIRQVKEYLFGENIPVRMIGDNFES